MASSRGPRESGTKKAARKMGEAQAWRHIAKLWDGATQPDDFSWPRVSVGHYSQAFGLCWCVEILMRENHIYATVAEKMNCRIRKRRARDDGFVWKMTLDGAKQRAAFCRRMARLCAPKVVALSSWEARF